MLFQVEIGFFFFFFQKSLREFFFFSFFSVIMTYDRCSISRRKNQFPHEKTVTVNPEKIDGALVQPLPLLWMIHRVCCELVGKRLVPLWRGIAQVCCSALCVSHYWTSKTRCRLQFCSLIANEFKSNLASPFNPPTSKGELCPLLTSPSIVSTVPRQS